jgi:hypothetical protein
MKHHLLSDDVIHKRHVLISDYSLHLVYLLGVLVAASFATALFAVNQLFQT